VAKAKAIAVATADDWAAADAEALAAMRHGLQTAPIREKIDIAKIIFAVTRPAPKASQTAPAIAGAVAGHIAATLAKAAERQQTRELQRQTATDATFTPLGRVENSE
jgi:hypothetical protein